MPTPLFQFTNYYSFPDVLFLMNDDNSSYYYATTILSKSCVLLRVFAPTLPYMRHYFYWHIEEIKEGQLLPKIRGPMFSWSIKEAFQQELQDYLPKYRQALEIAEKYLFLL